MPASLRADKLHGKIPHMIRLGEKEILLPRNSVRFPVELRPPQGFALDDPGTWPRVEGRLEFVRGRLLFMPPCGDEQGDVAIDVALILRTWTQTHSDYIVSGNEAGMLLGGEVRGADAAVWHRRDAAVRTGGYRRTPPILAAEVAGQDEGADELRGKASWYLSHGVKVVWLILPASREVIVIEAAGERRFGPDDELLQHPDLPALSPPVAAFFAQLAPG